MGRTAFSRNARSLRILTLAAVLGALLPASGAPPELRPTRLRCENAEDPLGVDVASPRLSWILESPDALRNQAQSAYALEAASSPALLERGAADLWRSGWVESPETTFISYAGSPVPSSTTAHWRVRVRDTSGAISPWSTAAAWTTGIVSPADWKARWITSDAQPPAASGLPVFRRRFETRAGLKRALVHVTGLGHYDLLLDGEPVGNRFLDPAWSVYERTVYYATFDLTAALRTPGAHAFALLLGKGFYNTRGDRRVHGVNSDRPLMLRLQAEFAYEDGSTETVLSDRSWRTAEGPITHSAILGGEDHDARRLPAGWSLAGFDDASWKGARETAGPAGTLRATLAPPMRIHERFAARRIDEPTPGIFVYDFGQNASAIPLLRVRGRAGDTVRLIPAEQRHGMSPRRNDGRGLVNPAGVGSPNYFTYTLRGDPGGESWSPRFTYSGFQYLQVEGAVPDGVPNPDDRPVVESLVSLHVRNEAPAVGTFACSNPLLNDIDRIISWAIRANLAHVLTDCPHREKLGWLEVSYLLGPALAGRHDLSRFYAKVARDIHDSQRPDGQVPTVAPAYPRFEGGFAFTPEWGAAAVLNPWLVFEWYGDRGILAEHYPSMKAFVDHLAATSRDLVPAPGLGDWYDYGHGQPSGPSRFTPPELSAMATFHRCTRRVADTARELGLDAEAEHYRSLARRIAEAFHARWFDGVSEYRHLGSPQTAHSMALTEGLVPAPLVPVVFERLVADLQSRQGQQTSGDIGYPYLLRALAEHGRPELLYTLALRTNLGSYGFIVRNGWTSLPEAWDADTGASMNHCMLGHIQDWFLGGIAGIRPDPRSPGFRRFVIDPHPGADLTWARGSYDSIRGPILSEWRLEQRRFSLRVRIPPNTRASLRIPAALGAPLTEGGRPAARHPDLVPLGRSGDREVLEAGSGDYHFESTLP